MMFRLSIVKTSKLNHLTTGCSKSVIGNLDISKINVWLSREIRALNTNDTKKAIRLIT